MAASSVTGTGTGSVEGHDMRRKEYSISANRIKGPRVVAAGVATLAGGFKFVKLPPLPGVTEDYIVLCTDQTAVQAVGAMLVVGDTETTIVISGNDADDIQWTIITVGLMP